MNCLLYQSSISSPFSLFLSPLHSSLLSSHPITLLPSTACNVSEPELQQVLDGVHEVPGHWLATDGARGWRARGPGRQRATELEAGPHKVLDGRLAARVHQVLDAGLRSELALGVLSCADIIAFITRDMSSFLGGDRGVNFDMAAGRLNGHISISSHTSTSSRRRPLTSSSSWAASPPRASASRSWSRSRTCTPWGAPTGHPSSLTTSLPHTTSAHPSLRL